MSRPRQLVHDPERVAAVRATGLLDTDVEEAFDRMTRLAVKVLGVSAAFISLVDENRDFYKSACGFGEPLASARELRGLTFCHFAIESAGPLVINDTRADPVFRSVPTVESLGIRAYVGIPLVDAQGFALGSFCAIDVEPRQWTDTDVEVLVELAESARREIDLRGQLRLARRLEALLRDLGDDLSRQVLESRALGIELQDANQRLAARLGEGAEPRLAG